MEKQDVVAQTASEVLRSLNPAIEMVATQFPVFWWWQLWLLWWTNFVAAFWSLFLEASWVNSGWLGSTCQDGIRSARDWMGEMPVRKQGRGRRSGQGELQTMITFWDLDGRRKERVGDIVDCSMALRKSWPGWWGVPEQRLLIRGTQHWVGIAWSRTSAVLSQRLGAAWRMCGLVWMLWWVLKAAPGGCWLTRLLWAGSFSVAALLGFCFWPSNLCLYSEHPNSVLNHSVLKPPVWFLWSAVSPWPIQPPSLVEYLAYCRQSLPISWMNGNWSGVAQVLLRTVCLPCNCWLSALLQTILWARSYNRLIELGLGWCEGIKGWAAKGNAAAPFTNLAMLCRGLRRGHGPGTPGFGWRGMEVTPWCREAAAASIPHRSWLKEKCTAGRLLQNGWVGSRDWYSGLYANAI